MEKEDNMLGKEIVTALKEVEMHVHGKNSLATRVVNIPDNIDVKVIRNKIGLSQQKFADTFGLNVATVREWEQKRRSPEGPSRVLLTMINIAPDAVINILHSH
jgi:putative transcriptional regulator